jgi:hypothetical protein
MAMRWLLGAFLICAMFSHAAKAAQWALFESDEKYDAYYDKAGVGHAEYPAAPSSYSLQKSVVQVWVKIEARDPVSGRLNDTEDQLWAFDCEGNVGTMAWADDDFDSAKNTNDDADFTARAKLTGIEPYLSVIAPESFGDSLERVLCSARHHARSPSRSSVTLTTG